METPPEELPDCCITEPPIGLVTLQLRGSTEAAGVQVVFQDGLSNVLEIQTTDALGTAHGLMKGTGFVTVINPFGPVDGRDDIRTFAGVRPFDQLTLDAPAAPAPIAVTVTAAIEPGATTYELATSCGAGTLAVAGEVATGTVTLAGCNGTAELLLVTKDADGRPRRSVFFTSPVADGASIALPNSYEPIPDVTIQYSGVDDFDRIAARTLLGRSRPVLEQTAEVAINTGVGSTTLPLPSIGLGTLMIESVPVPREADLTIRGVFDWGPSGGATQFVDMWQDLLPAVTSRPVFQPPNVIAWTEAAFAHATLLESSVPPPVRGPELVIVDLALARGDRQWTWTVAAPYRGPSLALPVLPDELALQPDDTVTVSDLFLAATPLGYDSVRGRILSSHRPQDLIVDPFAGRIAFQDLR